MKMEKEQIWTFFYGSYMNLDVLKQVNYKPEKWEVAKLNGYDIRISPRANLFRSDRDCVYGIVATAKHSELDRLYAHAQNVLGELYLPEAVLVETMKHKFLPALCYICPKMKPRPAAKDYVDRIVAPAKKLGFPKWYIEKLKSFAPA
ncbi:MAG: hypothetical protein C5B54_07600 [Acidobacteria bacterium]|nr:MAG: hypothetical protein C5B54_07600 [Acidobacteriota bacterium]